MEPARSGASSRRITFDPTYRLTEQDIEGVFIGSWATRTWNTLLLSGKLASIAW